MPDKKETTMKEINMQIILNGAKCLKCGDLIFSRHRHDYVTCKCRSIAVDGGTAYLRRMGEPSEMQEAGAYAPEKDKGGECEGMFLIYSPQGRSNPQTVFCRKEEAFDTAGSMKSKFGGAWYVTGPLEAV